MYAQKKRAPNPLAVAAVALAALLTVAVAGLVLLGVLLLGPNRAAAPVSEQIVDTQPALIAEDPTTQGEAPIEIPLPPRSTRQANWNLARESRCYARRAHWSSCTGGLCPA